MATILENAFRPDFIPAEDYRGEDIFALEQERLWPRVWQIACREEEIPEIGDFVNYEILDESILIVRTAADDIRAFYNVCQHRGRRLTEAPKGNVAASGFVCRFHGWRFRTDGSCAYVHDEKDWADCPDFKMSDLSLKAPQVDRWGGWVWINMDPDAVSLHDYLAVVPGVLDPFDFAGLRFNFYETIIAPVNWKVVVEAFHEGYHSGATHDSAVGYHSMHSPTVAHGLHAMFFSQFDAPSRIKKDGVWTTAKSWAEMFYYQSLELNQSLAALAMDPMMRALETLCREMPDDAPIEEVGARMFELHKIELEKTGVKWPEKLTPEAMFMAGTSWHIFPNTIVLPAADGTLWYRFRPVPGDPDKCIFDIWSMGRYPEGKAPKVEQNITDGFEAFRGRNAFLEQDFDNMVAVNKGMKSRGWPGARTNPKQESTVNNFHLALKQFRDTP